jgi:hypothetical protein
LEKILTEQVHLAARHHESDIKQTWKGNIKTIQNKNKYFEIGTLGFTDFHSQMTANSTIPLTSMTKKRIFQGL